ncbi:hypothetical protein EA187_17315 [Lujinxingia sediminis]|uniref:Mucin-like domain-containing protein n=1 Tax=Lujinxingia sediminis TaxID=2480984 RepID=A0ABY0CPF4_9DELT|nr:hypothetical protein EA187_17315 [Lujinxingia sediminis]
MLPSVSNCAARSATSSPHSTRADPVPPLTTTTLGQISYPQKSTLGQIFTPAKIDPRSDFTPAKIDPRSDFTPAKIDPRSDFHTRKNRPSVRFHTRKNRPSVRFHTRKNRPSVRVSPVRVSAHTVDAIVIKTSPYFPQDGIGALLQRRAQILHPA